MQGYSSCKQNHMKICYKCAQISFLGVKLWNVQYVEVKLRYRQNTKSRHPKPEVPLFPHCDYFIGQPNCKRAAVLKRYSR